MDMFSALADPTRRNIIALLAVNGKLSATDISKNFHITPPAISQHLKVLRETHIVDMEKQAQQRIYYINVETMQEAKDWIHHMTSEWNNRFYALNTVLQKEKKKLNKQRGKEVPNGKQE